MSFAEVIIFILLGIGVFYILSPLQKRLEAYFYRLFRGQRGRSKETIDINNYVKRENRDGRF